MLFENILSFYLGEKGVGKYKKVATNLGKFTHCSKAPAVKPKNVKIEQESGLRCLQSSALSLCVRVHKLRSLLERLVQITKVNAFYCLTCTTTTTTTNGLRKLTLMVLMAEWRNGGDGEKLPAFPLVSCVMSCHVVIHFGLVRDEVVVDN